MIICESEGCNEIAVWRVYFFIEHKALCPKCLDDMEWKYGAIELENDDSEVIKGDS